MQIALETHGRPLVPEVASHEQPVHAAHVPKGRDLWPEQSYPGPRWHMVIDLDACTGCSACVVACQAENNVPVVGQDEVRRSARCTGCASTATIEGQGEADVAVRSSAHAVPALRATPPARTVCPVHATMHSADGLNQQVYNRCVGTRYCANNCPYKVRRFNWWEYPFSGETERLALNPDVTVRSRGVMEKCTFCVQRIQDAKAEARREKRALRDGEIQTACQQSCPARAIVFGDLNDPKSKVAHLREKPRAYRVLEELGVQPGVTYLARVRAEEARRARHELTFGRSCPGPSPLGDRATLSWAASLTRAIAALLEPAPGGPAWWSASPGAGALGGPWLHRLHVRHGHRRGGLNSTVGWAFDITNFVFWVGIGHAGTLISAILFLFRQKWRTGINRFAEAMTIFAVMCAAIFPLIHMGRPWLAFWPLPYPNSRGSLWVNFRSPLAWDVFAISNTYFTVSLMFWYLGLIPDLATMRDRASPACARSSTPC